MNAHVMRAKMLVTAVTVNKDADGKTSSEQLNLCAVGSLDVQYDAQGKGDEDNTFSRWTPCANLSMVIQNPALFDQFKAGDKLYVDFSRAE